MKLRPCTDPDDVKRVAHRLPCTIAMDGEVPTARAFCPFPEPLQSFRGRKLQHGHIEIPQSSQLVFVEVGEDEHSDDKSNASFNVKYVMDRSGYFYQHDTFPDPNSSVSRAIDWLGASAALHAPVKVTPDEEPKNQATIVAKE